MRHICSRRSIFKNIYLISDTVKTFFFVLLAMTSNKPEDSDPSMLTRVSDSVLQTLGMAPPEKKASLESAANKAGEAVMEARDVIKDESVKAKIAILESKEAAYKLAGEAQDRVLDAKNNMAETAEAGKDEVRYLVTRANDATKEKASVIADMYTATADYFQKDVVDPIISVVHTLEEKISNTPEKDENVDATLKENREYEEALNDTEKNLKRSLDVNEVADTPASKKIASA